MQWQLEHHELSRDSDHTVNAFASVYIKDSTGMQMLVSETEESTEYYQASRTVLVDAANKLEQLAREMKSKADRMR
jgi:hypothetical protein